MTEGLKLNLPERKPPSGTRLITFLLAVVAVLAALNAALSLKGSPGPRSKSEGSGLNSEAVKKLALKLEKQGLRSAAAKAWEEYLEKAGVGDAERSRIYYRIGKIHQEARNYEEALNAFYRSESLANVDEISGEIARRSQECLEALGKFAALRYELADRVGLGRQKVEAGEEIVAEIGTHKITKAELDGKIEALISQQLAQYKAFLPSEEIQKQKEALFKQYSSASERQKILEQLITEEILYRNAREMKLSEEPDTREFLRDVEKKILAQKVVEKEYAEKIKITPADLETYYDAHKDEYIQKERARVSHILVASENAANIVLERIKSDEEFEKIAKELSLDKDTAKNGGEIDGWFEKGSFIPGIGFSENAWEAIFSTEEGKIAEKVVKTEKGCHIIKVRKREEERQKIFEEVRKEVFTSLRRRKEREVQEMLFRDLKDKYDVVLHFSRFQEKKDDARKKK